MATGDVSLEPAGAGVKPTSCRDWAPRAWPGPRADARCESPLVSFLEPDLDADPDAAPLPADNWRERATRSASRYPCAIDSFHFADRFCAIGFSFDAIRSED